MIEISIHGSRISSISPGEADRTGCRSRYRATVHLDFVFDARSGRQQFQVVLALEPLLDDLHVQQPEEATAEAEAERL